jgi:UDP-N-acetylmuramate--alanine ligase
MYKINLKEPKKVHFIGIGGISMSGMAELLHTFGFDVTGSDTKQSKTTKHLESLGINIIYGQKVENITTDMDFVVYTTAVKEDNPEYQAVINANIPIMDRAELIGQIMLNYPDAIAIAGTHGKTTTTSMLSLILLEANLDPTISVGGILDNIGGNIRIGNTEHFITEACEYTNSFLKFNPNKGIILNVEAEHLDYFKSLEQIRLSFKAFAERLPKDGLLIINGDIENVSYFSEDLPCNNIITYSLNSEKSPIDRVMAHYFADNISYDELGRGSYDLIKDGKFIEHIQLGVVGTHNISNSLPCIALAHSLNVPIPVIKKGISSYTGTERRFEYKGEIRGVTIIDDYAHHPTEVKATLTAAKNYPHKNIYCVFQPHTYTRTKTFLKEFAQALSYADTIILSDIYAARENNPGDISSKDLKDELCRLHKDAYYFDSFDQIENFLLEKCTNGDLLITMGAGDIVKIGESLLGI